MRIKVKKLDIPRVFIKYRLSGDDSCQCDSDCYVCWSLDLMDSKSIRSFSASVFKDEPQLLLTCRRFRLLGFDEFLDKWETLAYVEVA